MFVETEKMELLPIRKTQRVLVRVPLSVSGKMNDEMPFEEESFTISVNAAGGLLQLRKLVSKGQRLRLFQAPPIPGKVQATGVLRCHTR